MKRIIVGLVGASYKGPDDYVRLDAVFIGESQDLRNWPGSGLYELRHLRGRRRRRANRQVWIDAEVRKEARDADDQGSQRSDRART